MVCSCLITPSAFTDMNFKVAPNKFGQIFVIYVLFQKQVREFHHDFQTREKRWKHEAASAEWFYCFRVFGNCDETQGDEIVMKQ